MKPTYDIGLSSSTLGSIHDTTSLLGRTIMDYARSMEAARLALAMAAHLEDDPHENPD